MTPTTTVERVFIVGATGNVPVTVFARNLAKVSTLFPDAGDLLNVFKGDFSDLSAIKEGIKGHTRALLLVQDLGSIVQIKKTIATYAYEAGVKQVVGISTSAVNLCWRASIIESFHYHAEKAIYDIPNYGSFVSLRPSWLQKGYISTNDIAAVAATILREDVAKRYDVVYNLVGEVITPRQLVESLSRITGKKVRYQQISATEVYNNLVGRDYIPHLLAPGLTDHADLENNLSITPTIEILPGRNPEAVEEYLHRNKDKI